MIARQAGKGGQCIPRPRRCTTRRGIIWVFPKIGVPQNGWFIMENPIKMDDLGVPLFLETPICRFIDKCCAPPADLGWYHREAAPNFPVTGWWQLRDPVRTGTQQFWKDEWIFSLHNHTFMSYVFGYRPQWNRFTIFYIPRTVYRCSMVFCHPVVPPAEVEEIDEALERLEVEEPIRVEMRCEISGWWNWSCLLWWLLNPGNDTSTYPNFWLQLVRSVSLKKLILQVHPIKCNRKPWNRPRIIIPTVKLHQVRSRNATRNQETCGNTVTRFRKSDQDAQEDGPLTYFSCYLPGPDPFGCHGKVPASDWWSCDLFGVDNQAGSSRHHSAFQPKKLLDSAGDAWVKYKDENAIACAVRGDGPGFVRGLDGFS